jgi:hypothetical protein
MKAFRGQKREFSRKWVLHFMMGVEASRRRSQIFSDRRDREEYPRRGRISCYKVCRPFNSNRSLAQQGSETAGDVSDFNGERGTSVLVVRSLRAL